MRHRGGSLWLRSARLPHRTRSGLVPRTALGLAAPSPATTPRFAGAAIRAPRRSRCSRAPLPLRAALRDTQNGAPRDATYAERTICHETRDFRCGLWVRGGVPAAHAAKGPFPRHGTSALWAYLPHRIRALARTRRAPGRGGSRARAHARHHVTGERQAHRERRHGRRADGPDSTIARPEIALTRAATPTLGASLVAARAMRALHCR